MVYAYGIPQVTVKWFFNCCCMLVSSRIAKQLIFFKPVFHFNRTVPKRTENVPKRTGEHAQIEKRFINHVLPGVFSYQNEKFVTSQLFGVLRKY
jgi:hypothetical protein